MRGDVDVPLAELQDFLADTMTADFGGRGVDAQELIAEFEAPAVVEGDLHEVRALVKLDLGGDGIVLAKAGHWGSVVRMWNPDMILEGGPGALYSQEPSCIAGL